MTGLRVAVLGPTQRESTAFVALVRRPVCGSARPPAAGAGKQRRGHAPQGSGPRLPRPPARGSRSTAPRPTPGRSRRWPPRFRVINIDADPGRGRLDPRADRRVEGGGPQPGDQLHERRLMREVSRVPQQRARRHGPLQGQHPRPSRKIRRLSRRDLDGSGQRRLPEADPGARRAPAGGPGRGRLLPGQHGDRGARREDRERPLRRSLPAGRAGAGGLAAKGVSRSPDRHAERHQRHHPPGQDRTRTVPRAAGRRGPRVGVLSVARRRGAGRS